MIPTCVFAIDERNKCRAVKTCKVCKLCPSHCLGHSLLPTLATDLDLNYYFRGMAK